MSKPLRLGSAISMVALASMIAGCAAPQKLGGIGGKANSEVGLATRALAALNSNDVPTAIGLAERAVAKTPDDAGFRALLGNAYFAGGRFRSAETAYKDALSIYSNQPQVVLKLALVEIALGKKDEALALLEAGRGVLAPADYGLALALAGRPSDAIPVLQEAARAAGADSRVRQNLALAYGLAGDWTEAKTVASQDVPGSLLDSRIQQWMQLATPAKPSDQVAALVGVTPVAVDQGEPAQLALVRADAKLAAAAPAAAPAPAPAPVAAAPEQTRFVEAVAPPPPPPPFAPSVADAAPASQPKPEPVIAQGVGSVTAPLPAAREVAMAGFVTVPKFRPHARHVAVTTPAPIRTASVQRGNSPAVVQLGAYGSPKNVLTAWNMAAHKYAALRAYLPVSARFASPRGIFYRLSVKGFTSDDAARNMCIAVRRSGGNCFVRNIAGDAPVQIAMR